MIESAEAASTNRLEIALLHRLERPAPHAVGLYAEAACPPAVLRDWLEQRRSWTPTPPDQLLKPTAPPDRNAVLITFDDAYRSFKTAALPLLEEYEIPCLLFVPTAFVGGDELPYEMALSDLLAAGDTLRLPGGETVELGDARSRNELYGRLRMPLKFKSRRDRRAWLEELLRLNPAEAAENRSDQFLSWDELCELDRHPLVTLGAHGHDHLVLTALSYPEAWTEIRRSKRELEQRLGHRVDWFAYPYGADGRAVRGLVRLAGFRGAFTTRFESLAAGQRLDRFSLPRLDLSRSVRDAAEVPA